MNPQAERIDDEYPLVVRHDALSRKTRHNLMQAASCLMLVISSFAPPEPTPPPAKMDTVSSTTPQPTPQPQQSGSSGAAAQPDGAK